MVSNELLLIGVIRAGVVGIDAEDFGISPLGFGGFLRRFRFGIVLLHCDCFDGVDYAFFASDVNRVFSAANLVSRRLRFASYF